jgi:uncharacterized protein
MCDEGQGVLQDNQRGHMWLNISAANGFTDAADHRDRIAEGMTPTQIEKALAMARRCMESDYKDC